MELLDIVKVEEVEEDDGVGKLSAATVPAGKLVQWMRIGGIKLTLEDRDAMDGQNSMTW